MEGDFQTSFIPKKPLSEDRVQTTKPVSIFVFIATIIFFASLLGAGLMYFYKASLIRSVSVSKVNLDKAKEAFEGDFIKELQDFDRRISASNEILSNHVTLSPIFEALGLATLKSVQFTKFSHKITGTGNSAKILVTMSGKADNYTAIALQSDQLTQNKYIKDPIFENLTLDDRSNVLFDLTFQVDPSFVLFGEKLNREQSLNVVVDTTSTTVGADINTSDLSQ